jgi:hypothetical protein
VDRTSAATGALQARSYCNAMVYYEARKRELNTRLIYECKDRDEVNRRDVTQCRV